MVNYIDDMRYYGRIAAKEYAGIESKEGQENGWLVQYSWQHHLAGQLQVGIITWGWSPAANAWMMQNVYDYYKFTKDETYLKEKNLSNAQGNSQVLEFLLALRQI